MSSMAPSSSGLSWRFVSPANQTLPAPFGAVQKGPSQFFMVMLMPRLPTVVLRHRRSGDIRKVNLPEYARDVVRWQDWRLLTSRRGDAYSDVVRAAAQEYDSNRHRLSDPGEQAIRGDHARAAAARAITVTPTEPEPPSDVESAKDENWRSMPWFSARAVVKARTGVLPRNKAHAEALMAAAHVA